MSKPMPLSFTTTFLDSSGSSPVEEGATTESLHYAKRMSPDTCQDHVEYLKLTDFKKPKLPVLKKKEKLTTSSSHDSPLGNPMITTDAFVSGSGQSYSSGESCSEIESSSPGSPASSDFSATSASDYNISRLLSLVEQLRDTLPPALAEVKAWQQVMKPKIDEALVWQRDIGPLLTEMAANQRVSQHALQAMQSEIQRAVGSCADVGLQT